MAKLRLLDLFCGVGGAAMGYFRAGFTEIVGVDIVDQPHYPFTFVRANALTYPLEGFDLIHASPTCQAHSKTRKILEGKGLQTKGEASHIEAIRKHLHGRPYIIENVPMAPLLDPIRLCGTMFGLKVFRHRHFESSLTLLAPSHAKHVGGTNSHRGYSTGAAYITVGGNNYNRLEGAAAMGIDWPTTRPELSQAIPPAYTEYLGRQILGRP